MRITLGVCPFAGSPPVPSKIPTISALTSSRRPRPRPDRSRTAATIRPAAAIPTSAEMRISSSASVVSTVSAPGGRLRWSGASACRTRSSKRPTICCVVRRRSSRQRLRRFITSFYQPLNRRQSRGVGAAASAPQPPRGHPCDRLARQPFARQSAARRHVAPRAPGPRLSS